MKKLGLMLLGFLLVGCTTTEVIVLKQEMYVLVKPNEALLGDCKEAAPPSRNRFVSMNIDQREDILTRTLVTQYKYTKECTKQKQAIREHIASNEKTIEEYNRKVSEQIEARKKELEK